MLFFFVCTNCPKWISFTCFLWPTLLLCIYFAPSLNFEHNLSPNSYINFTTTKKPIGNFQNAIYKTKKNRSHSWYIWCDARFYLIDKFSGRPIRRDLTLILTRFKKTRKLMWTTCYNFWPDIFTFTKHQKKSYQIIVQILRFYTRYFSSNYVWISSYFHIISNFFLFLFWFYFSQIHRHI